MKPQNQRLEIHAAFVSLVDVCARYRPIWSTTEISNRAMARLHVVVDMLGRAQHLGEGVTDEEMQGLREQWLLTNLLKSMNRLYDKLDRYELAHGPVSLREIVQPRSTMPLGEDGLLVFGSVLHERAAAHLEECEKIGFTSYHLQLIKNAVQRIEAYRARPASAYKSSARVGAYTRALNACIRVLLEAVDPCMTRFVEHTAFMEDFIAARRNVQSLTVDARHTYHVSGYGIASLRHQRATEWTPWNDPAAQLDPGTIGVEPTGPPPEAQP